MEFAVGADENNPGLFAGLDKQWIFRKEPVAWMNGIAMSIYGDFYDFRNIQVGLGKF